MAKLIDLIVSGKSSFASDINAKTIYSTSLYMSGAISTCNTPGQWISGMTNAAIRYNNNTAITTESYHPFLSMKAADGHVVNFGGLANTIGFYGYYSGRTTNGHDWYFTVNSSTGNWTMAKSITSSAFITRGGANTQVVRGDGTLQNINALSVSYASTAGAATKDSAGNTIASYYLPLSGGTMTGPIRSDSGYVILNPIGASYHTVTSPVSGCITINLPASVGNTMVSMWIDVYIYGTQSSFSVHCGGYTYSNSTWQHSPFAIVYGANHRVRLGHNGTQFVVYIGETDSSWSYPQVSVRNVTLGYSPTLANWANAWSVSFSTSVSNVTYDTTTYAWTTKNLTKSSIGLGNVQNTAFYERITTVNGEGWNLAGTNSNNAFSIYAPTTAGSAGQVLTSTGGTPGWTTLSYYTEAEADDRFVNVTGDTMTGALTMNAGTGFQMKYTSGGNDPWIYPHGASNYGIRYYEGTPDKMAISASGNNNSTSGADLCINGNGEGTVTIRGNNIWHAGNDGSGSGLDADLLDGLHGTRYLQTLGGSNYITITVGGDADTYYPVVISNVASKYPLQLVNISRGYGETAPSSWNTSTHKGGLTLTLLWNGSRYWDGNGSGNTCYCVYKHETYSTMVGGLGNSSSGKVVWLRGGGAVYHIHSMNGTSTSATVYTSTYTDGAEQVFAPKTSPSGISVRWPGYAVGSDYATTAGNADTVDNQHFSYSNTSDSPTYLWATNSSGTSFLAARAKISVNYAASAGSANSLSSTGFGYNNFTYFQTSSEFFGNSGWTHYLIANHEDGSTYFNFTIGLPFWGIPKYKRLIGGTENGWHTFITSENIGSQSVNYASSAGNADTTDGLHLYTRSLGVNGTDWTFASTSSSNATTHIYAPIAAGATGQILKSTGGTPTWMDTSALTAGKVTCPAGSADVFRPVVLTIPESNQLYYTSKVKANYASGKVQLVGIEIEDSVGGVPLIRFGSANKDSILWKVFSNDQTYANQGVYGFDMTYFGTGSSNTNRLVLHADNQTAATKVEAISITQDGVVTFSKTISGNISGNAATSTTANQADKLYMKNSTANGVFPVLFTNTASCGTPRYDSAYVDSVSGAGYNPSTNAFVGSIMTAGTHNSTSSLFLSSGTSTTSIVFQINGVEKARLAQPNGYFGIGIANPAYPLSVAGTVYTTTGFSSNGKAIIDSTGRFLPASTFHRNAGAYGVYDSHKVGHVWSMGTSYSISADGSSTNTLYGLAYFHTDWSNDANYNADGRTEVSTYAGGHQIAMVQNGKVNAALGTNIWSRGGFIKSGSNNDYALLGGGGHKDISNVQNTAFYQRNVTLNRAVWYMAGPTNAAAFTIFAPTVGGTSGQLLTSYGNAEPGWMNQADVKSDYFKTFDNSRTYYVNFGTGGTDKTWKKIVSASSSYTSAPSSNIWQATAIRGVIWLSGSNHGAAEIVSYPFSAYFYYVRGTSLENRANLYLPHAGKTPNVMRIVRVSTNNFELQVRQHSDWTNGWVQWQVWKTGTEYCTCHTDLPAGTDAEVIKESTTATILTEAKTQVSFTRSLTSGTKVGTLTIDGTSTDLYCQTNTNTDTLVTQSETTTSNFRPILFGATSSTSASSLAATITSNSYVSTNLYVKPSTGNLYATILTAGRHNSPTTLVLSSGDSSTSIIFQIGGVEKARLAQPNGYLGINTSAVTYPLTVNGAASATRFITGTNQYRESGGLLMNNSDIWEVNAIYTNDLANNGGEGYQFKRTNDNYDSIWSADGTFYYSPNGNPTDGYGTNYTVCHSGNSTVTGGGSSWGSSISVKIAGTTKTLTIPSNPNTDSKVIQTTSTTASYRPVVLGYSSSSTPSSFSSHTNQVYITTKLYAQPSTGSLYATAFYESSDERLKDFENDIDTNFNAIRAIPKKYFRWKERPNDLQIGTSAQVVQKFYPEIVTSNGDGFLNVDYSKLSLVALSAIDKLHLENQELKHEINLLKQEIQELKKDR